VLSFARGPAAAELRCAVVDRQEKAQNMMQIVFFKGQRSGQSGELDGLIRKLTKGPYSHCALVFSDGVLGEATNVDDAGVRFAPNPNLMPDSWDFVELPAYDEGKARTWFVQHEGQPYDYKGALRMADPNQKGDPDAWYCSEACATALGLPNASQTDPNGLYRLLSQ
jgi:hypothetical protein